MKLAEQPRWLLVAGPNGAGKTTVTERGLAHEWSCRLNRHRIVAKNAAQFN